MLSGKKGRIATFGILGILILAAASWMLLLQPRISEAGEIQSSVAAVESQNASDQANLGKLQKLAKEAPAAAQRASVIFKQMPAQVDFAESLQLFMKAATSAGLAQTEIPSLTPGVPVPVKSQGNKGKGGAKLPGIDPGTTNIAQVPITVTVDTTQDKFMKYLENLQSMDRIFIVNAVSMTNKLDATGQANSQVSGQIKGNMYVLQTDLPDIVAEVDKMLTDAGVQHDSPAVTETPVASPSAAAASATASSSALPSPVASLGAPLPAGASPLATPVPSN